MSVKASKGAVVVQITGTPAVFRKDTIDPVGYRCVFRMVHLWLLAVGAVVVT
jgi:hypothetical protein